MVQVKATNKVRIAKRLEDNTYSYSFEAGEIKDVPESVVNFLLDTGLVVKLDTEVSNTEEE